MGDRQCTLLVAKPLASSSKQQAWEGSQLQTGDTCCWHRNRTIIFSLAITSTAGPANTHTHTHAHSSILSLHSPTSPCNTHTYLHLKHKCCSFSNYTVHTIFSVRYNGRWLLYRTTVPCVISTSEIPQLFGCHVYMMLSPAHYHKL